MVHELGVWLFSSRVGTLALNRGRLQFQYSAEWLQRPDALALSCSLPLQVEAFDDAQARPFFAGLLPEGRLRQLIAQRFHVSTQNDFALLDHIGGECAGAVTFLEAGQSLPYSRAGEVKWLSDGELAELLDRLPRRPMLAGEEGLRLSLAGAQDKLPVIVDGERIGLPLGGRPSTHILKPSIEGVEDSVANEGFCLALAAAMGFRAVPSRIVAKDECRFLLVERYDRMQDPEGQTQRLHQEDFCQALGVVPEMKYQNEGGPGFPDCFALLRRVTRPAAPQVLRLLDAAIFNALIGNHDAHGKNFSLLYANKVPVLAPLYDTLSTAVYPELTPKMAMKIGSKYKFNEIQPRHWAQFAEGAGLSVAQTKRRILELAQRLPDAARELEASRGEVFSNQPLVGRIVELIAQRSTLTIRRLKESGHPTP